MREQATRTGRRSRKGIACAAVLACVLGAGCLAWGCTPAAAPSDGADKTADSTTTTEPAPATSDGYSDQLASISGFPTEGRFVDGVTALPGFYKNSEKNAANAEANEPLRYTDRNGFTVQPVPSDDRAFNITYLNAENRGCTSCHTLESAIMSLPTYHRLIFFGYPTEQTFANCIACHSKTYQGTNYLGEAIHNTHMTNAMFTSQGGTCFSCHYNDVETQTLGRWDDYKYNLYHGITDVAAEEVQVTTSYDQTTITPAENRFFKTVKDEPSEWLVDDTQVDPSIYENWTVSIDGDCENPVEMTLPEMEQQFGTVKQVMKMDCTINGVGQATIMQSEVEGIPLSKVIEFAKPKASANIVSPIGSDGYDYAQMPIDWVVDNNAILVTKMDGETLPNTQGYPCMVWVYNTSGGNFVKRISNLTFMTQPEDAAMSQVYLGEFADDCTGEVYSKPNSGVLNYPTNVVLTGDEAKPVHLEGFAGAWNEPIKKLEFSFDHGATWTTLDTPNNDSKYWTYWRMDFTPPEAGTYLMDIRTTSIAPDGSDHVSQYDTQFMFTVE